MGADEKREREREAADLAALADGTLPPARRRALEELVASSPRLQALLAEQRTARAAIRARDETAPPRLHEAVARLRERRRRRSARVTAGAAAFAAALAAIALIVLPASEQQAPGLTDVAALGTRVATADVPAGEPVDAWGLEYPDLSREYRWRRAGSRWDKLEGRPARTVFYRKDGHRIAYTILARGPTRAPHDARHWRRKDALWYAFAEDGRTVVAWERHGHMCVVSADGMGGRALVELITS